MPSTPRDSSILSQGGLRRAAIARPREHLPFRNDERVQGKRTGLTALYQELDSDGFEPFSAVLAQLDAVPAPAVRGKAKATPRRSSVATPRRSIRPPSSEESEEEGFEEYDVTMDADLSAFVSPLFPTYALLTLVIQLRLPLKAGAQPPQHPAPAFALALPLAQPANPRPVSQILTASHHQVVVHRPGPNRVPAQRPTTTRKTCPLLRQAGAHDPAPRWGAAPRRSQGTRRRTRKMSICRLTALVSPAEAIRARRACLLRMNWSDVGALVRV